MPAPATCPRSSSAVSFLHYPLPRPPSPPPRATAHERLCTHLRKSGRSSMLELVPHTAMRGGRRRGRGKKENVYGEQGKQEEDTKGGRKTEVRSGRDEDQFALSNGVVEITGQLRGEHRSGEEGGGGGGGGGVSFFFLLLCSTKNIAHARALLHRLLIR
eukprot:755893-Hanusia_phi.AAC.4